jgi:hypothetical protein
MEERRSKQKLYEMLGLHATFRYNRLKLLGAAHCKKFGS